MDSSEFLNEHYNKHLQEVMIPIPIVVAGPLIVAMFIIKYITDKNASENIDQIGKKYCDNHTGRDKEACIIKVKYFQTKHQIKELKSAIGNCRKSDDFNTCKNAILEKIKKLKDKLVDYNWKYRELTGSNLSW